MRCPKCGEDLRRSKKDQNYGLCDNCRKKFKWVDDYDEEDEDYVWMNTTAHQVKHSNVSKPYSKNNKKHSSGIIKSIIVGFIALALIGTLFGQDDKKSDISDKNDVPPSTKSVQDVENTNITSSESSDSNPENDLATDEIIDSVSEMNIDINKCISDLKANLPLEPDYTFVNDYYIKADGRDLTISIVVDDATDPARALDFADTVVRQLNLYASMQDSNIALGNKDFYGGLYEKYSALVGVAQASKVNSQDEWLVFDAIVGGKTKLNLRE